MLFRKALENEIVILTNISKDAFNTDYLVGMDPDDGPPYYDDVEWHKQMYKEDHLYAYLDDENNIIGGALLFLSNNVLYIGRIFIDPKYFRKGYGYSLMLDIEKHFSGCKNFKLDTPKNNVRTNSLYKKLGYIITKTTDEEVNYEKQV